MKRLLLFAAAISLALTTYAAPKPNFIFILADDLGHMDIGAFNPKTFYETPNINGIARKGMRFTQGYAACPVCSPTRASIMTGKYPVRTGVTDYIGANRPGKLKPAPNADHLRLEEVTIAERFREAGYDTFFAGKWHLGSGEFTPNAQGFGPGLVQTTGQFYYPPTENPPDPKDDPKTTDRIADAAVKFIDAHKDKPFYAYLPFLAPHTPIRARQDLVDKYEKKKASAPPDAWVKERNSNVRQVQNHAAYAAMIEQLDTGIGRVLAALDRNGLADRTTIIFMSDNGGLSTSEGSPTSNVPLRGGKGWPYEGGIREPLIIFSPGLTKPNSVCESQVISTDFYPTLLDLAGLKLDPNQHRDGVSIVSLLKGGDLNRPAPLFWHYPHYGNQGGAPCGIIRDGDWKLIEWFEDHSLELYNIREDLSEKNDQAKANPTKTAELHAKLVAWRKEVNAVMPTPNPGWTGQPEAPAAKKKKGKKQ
jgi:arylsulfatase A-like enzyme